MYYGVTNNMKKLLSCAVVLLLFASLCTVFASAANTPAFVLSSQRAEAGDEVKVTLSVENNPGITSMKFAVAYDSLLTLKSVEYNTAFGGQTMQPEKLVSPVTLIWLSPFAECSTNGVFATLTFDVSDDAANNSVANISLSYDPDDVYNIKEQNVNFSVTNGKVTIAGPTVSVTGVTLNKSSLTIKTGDEETLVASVKPTNATNKNVSWKSSNTTVASVVNGTITGLKKGTATVTATTEDGGCTAACTVTVVCAHNNKTLVKEKDSTCTEKGWDSYYVCDDCGQTLLSDGKTEVSQKPFRTLKPHEGGTATCKSKAVCIHCNNPYGDYGPCNFTAEIQKTEAIKTPGNCCTKTEYFYSCSLCGKCEKDDSHTFVGDYGTHSFSHYVYNNDATLDADGTETAKCDYCNETDTRTAVGTKIGNPAVKIVGYKSEINTQYKATVTLHAEYEYLPENAELCWIVSDGNSSEYYTGETLTLSTLKKSVVVRLTAIIRNESDFGKSKVIAKSDAEKIVVNTKFFAKVVAFFKGLFGKLQVIDQK